VIGFIVQSEAIDRLLNFSEVVAILPHNPISARTTQPFCPMVLSPELLLVVMLLPLILSLWVVVNSLTAKLRIVTAAVATLTAQHHALAAEAVASSTAFTEEAVVTAQNIAITAAAVATLTARHNALAAEVLANAQHIAINAASVVTLTARHNALAAEVLANAQHIAINAASVTTLTTLLIANDASVKTLQRISTATLTAQLAAQQPHALVATIPRQSRRGKPIHNVPKWIIEQGLRSLVDRRLKARLLGS